MTFSVCAISSLEDVADFSRGRLIKCTRHCARPLRYSLLKLKSIVVTRYGFYSTAHKDTTHEIYSSFLLCLIGCNKFIPKGELNITRSISMQFEGL